MASWKRRRRKNLATALWFLAALCVLTKRLHGCLITDNYPTAVERPPEPCFILLGSIPRSILNGASGHPSTILNAQPRKRLPERTAFVHCAKCGELLYRYKKGGKGTLVKCYEERIVEDFTNGDLTCHSCGSEFARRTLIHGRPAHKMIGGKVTLKK
ncbi:unnamed protein product [Vitrella brassicaformis CCMP3155]|uniref:C2H2-type domain-containing protein n=2 Tax=Vitrella brassicaformis TaxID=1169539 RepID=A0A0G4GPL3_VITBC|nr:unnamed protein product [Vitrella brassicaformis CCMP3155]|eukprot:CEM32197.1 unnamed protein product [Vitrella brassicaformis CCMP3155]